MCPIVPGELISFSKDGKVDDWGIVTSFPQKRYMSDEMYVWALWAASGQFMSISVDMIKRESF